MVYSEHRRSFSLKKKGSSGSSYDLEESWRHCALWTSQSHKTTYYKTPFLWNSKVLGIGSRLVAAQVWGGGGVGCSGWMGSSDLCGDDCAALWMCKTTEFYILKESVSDMWIIAQRIFVWQIHDITVTIWGKDKAPVISSWKMQKIKFSKNTWLVVFVNSRGRWSWATYQNRARLIKVEKCGIDRLPDYTHPVR